MRIANSRPDPVFYVKDTGLIHYRARSYDPKIGRFISEDPLSMRVGPNPYEYVRNNPVMFTDPSGKIPLPAAALALEFALHIALMVRAFDLFPDDLYGRKKHCYVNCMSVRIHLGGATMSTVFSLGQEALNLTQAVPFGNLRSELRDSAGDLAADNFGQFVAFAIWKSCKELCDQCPSF